MKKNSGWLSKSCGRWQSEKFTQIQGADVFQRSLQPFQGFLWLDCTCLGFQASGMPDMKCPAFWQPLSGLSLILPVSSSTLSALPLQSPVLSDGYSFPLIEKVQGWQTLYQI